MADEFDQYKANTKMTAPVDEYAQYKSAPVPTDTIGVNRGIPPSGSPSYQYSTGYQGPNDAPRDSGGFIDRMETQAGRALQNPGNFIPSWKSLFPPLQAFEQARQEYQQINNPQPREDPAKTLGNMAPAAITALATHAADIAGNPLRTPSEVAARLPVWQQQGSTTTPLGGVPSEVQRALANMPKSSVAAPIDPVEIAADRYRAVNLQPMKAPAAQGATPNLPEMQPSQSTTISQHGYDPAKQQMFITFKNGNTYRYSGVPQEVYNQYSEAESHGSFHANNIKGRYQTDLVSKGKPTTGQQASQALDFVSRIQQQEAQKGIPQQPDKPEGMSPNEISLWQQGAFGEQPPADVGTKVRASMPSVPRSKK